MNHKYRLEAKEEYDVGLEVKKTATDKAKEIMATNWWVLWILTLANIVLSLLVLQYVSNRVGELLDEVKTTAKGVVVLDYSGWTAYIDKKTIDSTSVGFKAAVTNALRFYMVKDWQTLSRNYSEKISTIEELEAKNPDLVEFKENYVDSSKEAQLDFLSYEKTLLYLMSTDNLPEKITASGVTVNDYEVKGLEFKMTMTINVNQSLYLMESDRTVDRAGKIDIVVSGKFDPQIGTPINPIGIKFTSLKPTFLKKR
ncbi:MAG: hypothetical protein PHT07_10560 [Paludibacter sp.]|nr:hypothetical protein [Paludibacter sp.]